MEGILIAIISGLFGLAGIWLNNHLRGRKSAKPAPQPTESIQEAMTTLTPPKQKAPPRGTRSEEKPEKVVFFRMPSWWILTTGVIAVSIGAAFFVRWVVDYGLGVFNLASPDVGFSQLALGLGGLAWGLAYIVAGTANADDVVECLFPLFDPYDDLFGPVDLGDFVRALLSALPINLLVSWGIAIALGTLAATQFGANLSGVISLVFGSLVFMGIVWFLVEEF